MRNVDNLDKKQEHLKHKVTTILEKQKSAAEKSVDIEVTRPRKFGDGCRCIEATHVERDC